MRQSLPELTLAAVSRHHTNQDRSVGASVPYFHIQLNTAFLTFPRVPPLIPACVRSLLLGLSHLTHLRLGSSATDVCV